MRQRYAGPEQMVRPGTEYARSIARYRPRKKRSAQLAVLSHPLVPAIALGLVAAGVALLWPRQAHGRRWREADHAHDDATLTRAPSRRQRVSASGLATGLQAGGVQPGHSRAGAIGTGGGSTAQEPTGTLR